ncbi:MAG TPA: tetratricopeptide repeat protein, partial [Cytophagaceae bacterium]|nr:tetratricopeptide repeat protein [Cytophagaceae bacterium]
MKKLFLFFIMFLNISVYAQKIQKPINAAEIMKAYETFYKDEKYEEALLEIQKIDRNDTSYADALVETSIIYLKQKKYEEAVAACQKGLSLNSSIDQKFYINMAVAYNRAEKFQKAHEILDQGILKYPKNYLLHYNKGATYLSDKKFAEALEYFKKAIRLNPYYASAHLELSIIAANEGKISQAMMSMNMFLILEPTSTRSFSALQRFNEIVSSKYTREPNGVVLSPEGGDDFSELDLIITNYAALSKSYKVPVKTELPIVKQNYALFSKMTYDKDDKGFWMQTYVPFFKEIYNQNQFPGFSYYSLQSSENSQHIELIKKNISLINKFASWAGPYVDKTTEKYIDTVSGKKQVYQHWFDSQKHTLYKVGTVNEATQQVEGACQYYYSSGSIKSKGIYNSQGKKEGTWIFYYDTGSKEQEAFYKDGKLEGKLLYYNKEGTLIAELNYSNDVLSGDKKIYNGSGLLTDKIFYKDGSFEGPQYEYYKIGEPYTKAIANYLHNEIIDTVYRYYDNGALKSIKPYSNKAFNGEYTSFYRNGKIDTKGKYVNGLKEGDHKEYYENGQLYIEGTYLKGKEIGKWSTFNRSGKLIEESIYDDKGKRNGIFKTYDVDGKIICEMEYNSGTITEYKYFNKQGAIIKEAKKQKGEFYFLGSYPEGNKEFEGNYTLEGKNGIWKYYDFYENLTSEENYDEKGMLSGVAKKYGEGGALTSISQYANNVLEGPYYEYFRDGTIKSEGWYTDGLANGYFYSYYIDGTMETKAYFLNDLLSGFKEYYAVTGKLEKEEFYKEDVLQKVVYYDSLGAKTSTVELKSGSGNYTVRYPNGIPKFVGNYIEGAAHGKFTWYNIDGSISSEGSYFNNEKNGVWKWYHDNKKIDVEGTYVYGKHDGKWIYYYDNGKVKKIEIYNYGMKTGEWISYYENGQVEFKKTYIEDKENGDAFYYGKTGELQMKKIYKAGNILAYSYLDATGQLLPDISISNGNCTILSYYKNGNKSREYTLLKGAIKDSYKEYHFNGQIA